ncbi:uncharacterized protein VTP21DRAFT_1400 [Calcarisporiella thermophila]|uniref:uncharacterized protein n=1 Tax=Calcarisporiella thermophila TaxID=911321 RepID=UPI0037437100
MWSIEENSARETGAYISALNKNKIMRLVSQTQSLHPTNLNPQLAAQAPACAGSSGAGFLCAPLVPGAAAARFPAQAPGGLRTSRAAGVATSRSNQNQLATRATLPR